MCKPIGRRAHPQRSYWDSSRVSWIDEKTRSVNFRICAPPKKQDSLRQRLPGILGHGQSSSKICFKAMAVWIYQCETVSWACYFEISIIRQYSFWLVACKVFLHLSGFPALPNRHLPPANWRLSKVNKNVKSLRFKLILCKYIVLLTLFDIPHRSSTSLIVSPFFPVILFIDLFILIKPSSNTSQHAKLLLINDTQTPKVNNASHPLYWVCCCVASDTRSYLAHLSDKSQGSSVAMLNRFPLSRSSPTMSTSFCLPHPTHPDVLPLFSAPELPMSSQ